jgi:hypothetical protein
MNRVWCMESLLSKSHTGILDSNLDAVIRHHLDTIRHLRFLFSFAGRGWILHRPRILDST